MTDEQTRALNALIAAVGRFKQAEAHRIEMIELCRQLKVPTSEIRSAMELR